MLGLLGFSVVLGCGGGDGSAGALGNNVRSFAHDILNANIEAGGITGDSVSGFEIEVGF